jgi:hypothetical protein
MLYIIIYFSVTICFWFMRIKLIHSFSYFLPSTIELWTSLLPEIKYCLSFNIFKSRLISRVDHDKVPKYYYYDLRLISILQARLCMTSSSRNEHFYIIFFY